jgi:hypothetical protein
MPRDDPRGDARQQRVDEGGVAVADPAGLHGYPYASGTRLRYCPLDDLEGAAADTCATR